MDGFCASPRRNAARRSLFGPYFFGQAFFAVFC